MKVRMPSTSASRPPLTASLPTPVTYSPASYLATISSQFLRLTMLRWLSSTLPSPSLTFTTSTSISSPILTSVEEQVSFLNQSICLITDVDADFVIGDLHYGAR